MADVINTSLMESLGLSLKDAPTLEELKAYRDDMNSDWSATESGQERGLNDEMEAEEDLYFQNFQVHAPEPKWVVKTGSAPADVDAAIDTVFPTEITLMVTPSQNTQKAKDQAEKLTRFARAMINSWMETDAPKDVISDMMIRRVGVGRVIYDDKLWPEAPAHLEDEDKDEWLAINRQNPIVFERRNPRYTRWKEDERGRLISVAEEYETTVLEALRSFKNFPRAKQILSGLDMKQKVTCSDIWFEKWRCILLDDQPILPVGSGTKRGISPHLYPEIPYVLMPFRKLPFDNPARRYRGQLTNSAGLYPLESNALTMHMWILAWNAWRTMIGWTRDSRAISMTPGQYIMIDKRIGEYLEFPEGRAVDPELLNTTSTIDGYIQRNGVSTGPRSVQGTRSGEQVWAIQSQRLVKVESAKQNAQKGFKKSLRLAAMIAEMIHRQDLTLPAPGKGDDGQDMGELTIRPKDIRGYYRGFDVQFGKRIDPAVLQQAQMLSDLSTKGFMPWIKAVEMSGLTETPGEWERLLEQQGINSLPFMKEQAGLEQLVSYYGSYDHPMVQLFVSRLQQQKASEGSSGGPGQPAAGATQPLAMKGTGDVAANPVPAIGGGMQPNPQNGMK